MIQTKFCNESISASIEILVYQSFLPSTHIQIDWTSASRCTSARVAITLNERAGQCSIMHASELLSFQSLMFMEFFSYRVLACMFFEGSTADM